MEKKINHKAPLAYYQIAENLKNFLTEETVIICIGTDKFIGDCLGPLVGSFLKYNNFPLPVYGCIDSPIHALNLDEKILDITSKHPNAYIIGVDACLGLEESIGEIHIRDYAIRPGKGVGKTLPEVGSISIVGIVDSNKNSDLFSTRSIRLSLIFDLAKVICHGLMYSYYLKYKV